MASPNVRRTTCANGEVAAALVLKGSGTQRSYATLTALEHDTLNARIWGGLHFRDAMEDGYYLGHTTADEVMSAVR